MARYSVNNYTLKHCFPTPEKKNLRLQTIADYANFLEMRRKLMAEKIRDYYFSPLNGDSRYVPHLDLMANRSAVCAGRFRSSFGTFFLTIWRRRRRGLAGVRSPLSAVLEIDAHSAAAILNLFIAALASGMLSLLLFLADMMISPSCFVTQLLLVLCGLGIATVV